VFGGFDVPEVMGSRSTFLRLKIGGFCGRPLAAGDIVYTLSVTNRFEKKEGRSLPKDLIPEYRSPATVRAILGPQDNYFDENVGLKTFLELKYKVSSESNREGIRLIGPPIEIKKGMPKSIPSEAFPRGGIQVIPGGQLIIILNDSIGGGYAKIAHIISSDLPKVVQLLPGNEIQFKPITLSPAHQIIREKEEEFKRLLEIAD